MKEIAKDWRVQFRSACNRLAKLIYKVSDLDKDFTKNEEKILVQSLEDILELRETLRDDVPDSKKKN